MPKPPLPPLAERDGTLARANADDAAEWVKVHSEDGHPYWFPPEIAYLAQDGEDWVRLESLLRPALAQRAARSAVASGPKRRPVSPRTIAAAAALAAYCWEELDKLPDDDAALADAVYRFSEHHHLPGWETLDKRDSTLRAIVGAALAALRKIEATKLRRQ